ncbi:uncharacterized protein LOC143034972 [Oratosquilla oratoria]|uniref:uncharacterized protein LOC143034972 n=1 Tax=Oratosquilla oratoria TaxID=337810 RepID=UPI003F7683F9
MTHQRDERTWRSSGRGDVEGAEAEVGHPLEERFHFRRDLPPPLPRRIKIFLYMSRRPSKRSAPHPPVLQRTRSLDDLYPRLTYEDSSPSSSPPTGGSSSVGGTDASSDFSDTVSRNSGDSCFDQNESLSSVSEVAEEGCGPRGVVDSSFDNDDLSDEGIDVGRRVRPSFPVKLKIPGPTRDGNERQRDFHFDEATSSPEHTYEDVEGLFGSRDHEHLHPPLKPPPPLPPGTRPPRKNSREGGRLKNNNADLRSHAGAGHAKTTEHTAESRPDLDTDSSMTISAKPARPPRTRKSRLTLAKHMSTPNLSQGIDDDDELPFQRPPGAQSRTSGVLQYALANAFRISTSPREIASSVASLAAASTKPLPYFDLPHEVPVKPARSRIRKQRKAPLPPTETRNSQKVIPFGTNEGDHSRSNTHEGNQSCSNAQEVNQSRSNTHEVNQSRSNTHEGNQSRSNTREINQPQPPLHGQRQVQNQTPHSRKGYPSFRPQRQTLPESHRASSSDRSLSSRTPAASDKQPSVRRDQRPHHGRKPSEGPTSPSKASIPACRNTRPRSRSSASRRTSFSSGSSPCGPALVQGPSTNTAASTRPRGTSLPPRGRTSSTTCFMDSAVPTYVYPGPGPSSRGSTHKGARTSSTGAQGSTLTRQRSKNRSFLHSVQGRKTTQRNF